jgi:hypothetical protein
MPTRYTDTPLSFSESARPRALRSGAVDMKRRVVRAVLAHATAGRTYTAGRHGASSATGRAGAKATDAEGARAAKSIAHAARSMLQSMFKELVDDSKFWL